jgi:hypothetical protein
MFVEKFVKSLKMYSDSSFRYKLRNIDLYTDRTTGFLDFFHRLVF